MTDEVRWIMAVLAPLAGIGRNLAGAELALLPLATYSGNAGPLGAQTAPQRGRHRDHYRFRRFP
jgi:hypothetical protein